MSFGHASARQCPNGRYGRWSEQLFAEHAYEKELRIENSAQADTITVEFYVSGIFTSNGSNSISLGTGNGAQQLDVTFQGAGSSVSPIVVADPDGNSSETTIGAFAVDWGKNSGNAVLSDTFTLTIHQYLPGTGIDTVVGSVAGTINIASTGDVRIDFTGDNFGSISAADHVVVYTLAGLTSNNFYLPDPTPTTGIHTELTQDLQAVITHTHSDPAPVPEPTSLVLLGTGLGIIGLAARRRRR